MFRSFAEADLVLGLSRNALRAASAGLLSVEDARTWITALEEGPFLAAFVIFVVVLGR
ncbi:hypothetical protein Lesp02_69800 [Lentzea sp. NBRC 105346]|nr:hypothetical protein Lesp02_69800 [Lentzea sp. NBRC 105346]